VGVGKLARGLKRYISGSQEKSRPIDLLTEPPDKRSMLQESECFFPLTEPL
jgi:hypothetical protein